MPKGLCFKSQPRETTVRLNTLLGWMGWRVMEKMHGWKAIDLEVTRVNMLIQTVGDIRVPQRERGGLRAGPCRGSKGLWDEVEMSALKASEGNYCQKDVVCVTCDKCYRKSNVTRKV